MIFTVHGLGFGCELSDEGFYSGLRFRIVQCIVKGFGVWNLGRGF